MKATYGWLDMVHVRVVTDSGCDIPSAQIQRLGITVVPYSVRIGQRTYLDRVNLTTDQFFRRLASARVPVLVQPPAVSDFHASFTGLSRATHSVVSIHTSSKVGESYQAGLAAKNLISNQVRVVAIDSLSVSMGLGFLVLNAALAAQRGDSLEEVVALVRSMVLQTHVIFALETTGFVDRNERLAKLKLAAGDVADTRPLIQLEEGSFQLAEKVRTRAKAIERLYEFVELFPRIENLAVLYSSTPTDADALVKRIDAIFPKERITVAQYGPAVGAFLGPGALGVAAYEGRG